MEINNFLKIQVEIILQKLLYFEREFLKYIVLVLIFLNILDFNFSFPIFLFLIIFIGVIIYSNFKLNFIEVFTVFNYRWFYYSLFIILIEFFLINNISLIMNFIFQHFEWLQYFIILFIKKTYRFLICPIIIKPHNKFWTESNGRFYEKVYENVKGLRKEERKIFLEHPGLEFNGNVKNGNYSIIIGATSILQRNGLKKKDEFFSKFIGEKVFNCIFDIGDGQAFQRYKFVKKNKNMKLYKNMDVRLQKLINFRFIKDFNFLKFYHSETAILNPFVDYLNQASNQVEREEIIIEFQKVTGYLLENLTYLGDGSESLISNNLITSRGISILFEDDDLD